MELYDALKIFGFTEITKIDELMLRKAYRKLMKKNHPDIGGSEEVAKKINKANEVVLAALESLKKAEINRVSGNTTVFINFDSLIKIFNGDSVVVGNADNKMTIDRSNINRFNIVLDIDIKIMANGIQYPVNKLEPRNISDNYSITFRYFTRTLDELVEFEIQAYGKKVAIPVSTKIINLNLKYDNAVTLKVILERQLVVDE